MMHALEALGLLAVAELLMWAPGIWRARRLLSALYALGLAAITGVVMVLQPSAWAILLLVINIYQIVNLLRIGEARMQERYLYRASFLTFGRLLVAEMVVLGLWGASQQWRWSAHLVWGVVAAVQLALALILATSTARHIRTTRPPAITEHYTDKDLPTLTVAIPARNETVALEACLDSLVASNYPKLEILVLDDCSQDKTPEIIRSYAHDGVRFIQGSEPTGGWLAKNQAYQRLYEESNGELLLFCGVDITFEPDSLRQLVALLLQKRKTMLCVIPRNSTPEIFRLEQSMLLQPMRYAWEMALPRRLFNRPPVLSSCWLVRREVVEAGGGFKGVSRSISPESYFAKLSIRSDGYSFVQSNDELGVKSAKELREQWDTAVRIRYPQLHRRVELVMLVGLLEAALLPGALVLCVAGIYLGWPLVAVLSGCAYILHSIFFAQIVWLAYQRTLLRAITAFPVAVLLNVWVLNYSMWKYEFSQVIWKERDVSFPVMRVITRLPKL